MFEGRLFFACYIAFLLQLLLFFQSCQSSSNYSSLCAPSSCGKIENISYPFRLDTDPPNCGNRTYTLFCENNNTYVVLYLHSGRFYVQAINYDNFTIRVADAGVRKDDCSSLPRYSLSLDEFQNGDPYASYYFHVGDPYELYSLPRYSLSLDDFDHRDPYASYNYRGEWRGLFDLKFDYLFDIVTIIKCAQPVDSPDLYTDTAPCLNSTTHSYVNSGGMNASDLMELCSIEGLTPLLPNKDYKNKSFKEIHSDLSYGFELSWYNSQCGNCTMGCFSDYKNQSQCIESLFSYKKESFWLGLWNTISNIFVFVEGIFIYIFTTNPFDMIKSRIERFLSTTSLSDTINIGIESLLPLVFPIFAILHAVKVLCGTPCVIGFLIYKWRRRHRSVYDIVEAFLQNHNNLMPVRYSYSDIKKITGGFKVKLGEGGFGSVYKGKLRSGSFAAIKMLGKSKANGQDFINEVATIGRIHHKNVVQLIGYCAEGSKRALVYDFMPNGSLNNHIFSGEESVSLSWEKLQEISCGVARGIEYLHQGCEMQILHFDIKPHNILLDENFTPKVSDFGLARLYPTNGSIASLTAVRGTIGYMAPELFYKNVGRVSFKADVYSFGMLLLEMAGKRKNLNALAEKSSQIYWPYWIYDQVSNGKALDIGDNATEEENNVVKKMIIVGLWCIQMKPMNRPAMNKVVEMLEGDLESLELPPKPVLNLDETPINIGGESSSSLSDDSTESISLVENAY